jgi:hypothetical protein
MKAEDHEELTDIYEQMQELVHRAEMIMVREGGVVYEQARGYWLASFKTALSKDHSYIGGCMFTMQDAVDHALIDDEEDEDIDDDIDEDEAEYCDDVDENDDDDLLPED